MKNLKSSLAWKFSKMYTMYVVKIPAYLDSLFPSANHQQGNAHDLYFIFFTSRNCQPLQWIYHNMELLSTNVKHILQPCIWLYTGLHVCWRLLEAWMEHVINQQSFLIHPMATFNAWQLKQFILKILQHWHVVWCVTLWCHVQITAWDLPAMHHQEHAACASSVLSHHWPGVWKGMYGMTKSTSLKQVGTYSF